VPTPAIRVATREDLPALFRVDGRAFGIHYSEPAAADVEELIEPERFLLAEDPRDGAVGITGSFPFDLTVPGGGTVAAPGVTWVGVSVVHRRRGILRALMAAQHRAFVAQGVALSLLTASEGGIYGRFGYGVATTDRSVEISRRRIAFRDGVPDPGGVREVDTDELRVLAPAIHRRWAAVTPGALARSDAWWDVLLADREHQRRGGTALFHLVHPDGYASFRRVHADGSLRVVALVAVTPQARAALWRVLAAHDLVETIRVDRLAVDDPLPDLLTDRRQVRTTMLDDGMWARVLDVPAALAARRYAVEVDVVLDVHDPFLDAGGRFRLRGGPDGATCERTGGTGAAVATGIAALGSLVLGGTRAHALAGAGLLAASDEGVLRRLDRAFLADRSPEHGTDF
jgi:predicted acetyltransferase